MTTTIVTRQVIENNDAPNAVRLAMVSDRAICWSDYKLETGTSKIISVTGGLIGVSGYIHGVAGITLLHEDIDISNIRDYQDVTRFYYELRKRFKETDTFEKYCECNFLFANRFFIFAILNDCPLIFDRNFMAIGSGSGLALGFLGASYRILGFIPQLQSEFKPVYDFIGGLDPYTSSNYNFESVIV